MHICYLSPGSVPLPPAPSTSVEIYVWNLAQAMSRTHRVTLYGKGRTEVRKVRNLTRRTFATSGGLPYVHRALQDIRRLQASSPAPDIIQVENRIPFLPFVKKAYPRTPVLLNLHSNVLIQSLPLATVTHSLRSMDAMVVNSHFLKRFLLARYPVLSEDRVHVIPPGIDVAKFPSRFTEKGRHLREKMRRRRGVGASKKVILFVGRFIERKGIIVLLDAFREVHQQHPDSELWIIGGRPTKANAFHAEVRKKSQGLPVRFLGFINQTRLPEYYLAADVFVCPSQKAESFGMVNLEAAATGLPVVASNKWGIRESVREGVSGVLVKDYANPVAFAQAIGGLFASPERLEKLGRSGRQWVVTKCSWQQTAVRFARLYSKVTTRKKS